VLRVSTWHAARSIEHIRQRAIHAMHFAHFVIPMATEEITIVFYFAGPLALGATLGAWRHAWQIFFREKSLKNHELKFPWNLH
jgi:hypothetical protein